MHVFYNFRIISNILVGQQAKYWPGGLMNGRLTYWNFYWKVFVISKIFSGIKKSE